jgi:hypothetical protein
MTPNLGLNVPGRVPLRSATQLEVVMRSILLHMPRVPIPIIILIALFWH